MDPDSGHPTPRDDEFGDETELEGPTKTPTKQIINPATSTPLSAANGPPRPTFRQFRLDNAGTNALKEVDENNPSLDQSRTRKSLSDPSREVAQEVALSLIKAQKAKHNKSKRDNHFLNESIAEKEDEIVALKSELSTASGRIDERDKILAEKDIEIKQLQESFDATTMEFKTVEAKCTIDLQAHKADFETFKDQCSRDKQELEGTIANLRLENEKYLREKAQLQNNITHLGERLAQACSDQSKIEQKHDRDVTDLKEKYERDLKDMAQQNQILRTELDTKTGDALEMEQNLSDLQQKFNECSSKLSELNGELILIREEDHSVDLRSTIAKSAQEVMRMTMLLKERDAELKEAREFFTIKERQLLDQSDKDKLKFADIENALKKMSTANAQLDNDNRDMKNRLSEYDINIAQLIQDNRQYIAENDNLRLELNKVNAEMDQVRETVASITRNDLSIQQQHEEELNAMKTALENQKKAYELKIAESHQDLVLVKNSLHQTENELNGVRKELERVDKLYKAQENTSKELENEKKTFDMKNEAAKRAHDNMEKLYKAEVDMNSELLATKISQQSSAAELTKKNAELERELIAVQGTNDFNQKEIETLKEKLQASALELEKKTLELHRVAELEELNRQMAKDLDHRQKELLKRPDQSEVIRLRSELDNLVKEKEKLQNDLKEAIENEKKYRDAANRLDANKYDIEVRDKQNRELEVKVKSLEDHIAALLTDNTNMVKIRNDLHDEYTNVMKGNADLKEQNLFLQTRILQLEAADGYPGQLISEINYTPPTVGHVDVVLVDGQTQTPYLQSVALLFEQFRMTSTTSKSQAELRSQQLLDWISEMVFSDCWQIRSSQEWNCVVSDLVIQVRKSLSNLSDELRREVTRLICENDKLTSKLNKLVERNNKAEDRLQDEILKCKSLVEQSVGLETELRSLGVAHQDLKAEFERVTQSLKVATLARDERDEIIRGASQTVDLYLEQIRGLVDQEEELRADLEKAQADLETANRAHLEQRETERQDMDVLQRNNDSLTKDLQKAHLSLQKMRDERTSYDEALAVKKKQLQEARDVRGLYDAAMDKLIRHAEKMRQASYELKKKGRERQTIIENVARENPRLDDRLFGIGLANMAAGIDDESRQVNVNGEELNRILKVCEQTRSAHPI